MNIPIPHLLGSALQKLLGIPNVRTIKLPPEDASQAAHVHSGLARGSLELDHSSGPSSRFEALPQIIADSQLAFDPINNSGSIFLGVVNSPMARFPVKGGREEVCAIGGTAIAVPDDRHLITCAGNRSGKGRSVIIPNLASYGGSVLVVDPKGDLARLTAWYRREILGQKVIVFDPFGVSGRRTGGRHVFNPITAITRNSRTRREDAALIADSIVTTSPGSKDQHWDESAKQLLLILILHVALSPEFEGRRDLVTVYELVHGPTSVMELGLLRTQADDLRIAHSAANFFEKSDNERSGILSTLQRHTEFLGFPNLQNVLRGESSLDLRDLKRQRMSVYLSLPAMRMGSCSRWLRLFVNLALAAFEAEQTTPSEPVLMCLDEFPVLGTMKSIEDAAGQIAGLGCKLWPIVQDLGQLKALYSDRWETFLGNAGVLQFFGNSDLTTLEWISKRIGDTIVTTQSRSTATLAQSMGGADGVSTSQSVYPVMPPEEISRFFGRDDEMARQLIIRSSHRPMVLQRANYDKHPLFSRFYQYSLTNQNV